MKKPYQIEAQRAIKQLDAMVADGNLAVQMMLPMAEMMGWLRKGVGELIRQAGLQLMDLLMQEEVRELAGERSQRQTDRTAGQNFVASARHDDTAIHPCSSRPRATGGGSRARHADDGTVTRNKGRPSRPVAVLPDGRFL